MNTEDLGNSKILNLLFKPAGKIMGSRARHWLMNPVKTLKGAGIQAGQTVLEVGCGTGFFTIPAARMIGDDGFLVAMDPLSDFIKEVSIKVESALAILKIPSNTGYMPCPPLVTVLIGDKLTIRPFSSTSTAAARIDENHTPTCLPDFSKMIKPHGLTGPPRP